MDRQRFISVPKNIKSIEKYYYGEETKDDFESETIGLDKLNLAETTVINLKSNTNNKEIEKLHALIQEAIKRGTQISFDF